MLANNFKTMLKITKDTTRIMIKARNEMIGSTFKTVVQIASLYKDAGFGALKQGRQLLVDTTKLALDNQRHLIKTTGEALQETRQTIKEKGKRKKSNLTIDDLL